MFFKNKNILGLDIGTSSIKIAHIEDTKEGLMLRSLAIGDLPHEVVVEGEVMDVGIVVDKIRELIKEHSIKTKNAAVAVLGRSVIMKKIRLPNIKGDELDKAVNVEVKQFIPEIDDVNIDFQVIDNITEEDSDSIEVLLVVVKKEKINDVMNMVVGSGLSPSIVDVDGFALENQYELTCDEEDGTVALIDVGDSITNVIIMKDGNSIYTRDISIGGSSYTREIQKDFSLSFEQAETLKLGKDLEEVSRDNAEPIIQKIHKEVAKEIQGTFGYFKANYGDESISKVVLSGGCACMPGLLDFLEQKLEIPVELSNPLKNLLFDDKKLDPDYLNKVAPMLCMAIGLALRRVGDR